MRKSPEVQNRGDGGNKGDRQAEELRMPELRMPLGAFQNFNAGRGGFAAAAHITASSLPIIAADLLIAAAAYSTAASLPVIGANDEIAVAAHTNVASLLLICVVPETAGVAYETAERLDEVEYRPDD